MVKIFSYGTLWKKEVQRQVFDTTFIVFDNEDYVNGWGIIDIKINGTYYKMAVEETDGTMLMGAIVNVPDSYIDDIDQYEGEQYMRITVNTVGGRECQMYVKRVDY